MVTWATNNRGYTQSEDAVQIIRLGVSLQADLRNTTFGASSPAKPALHMPELETSQSLSFPVVIKANCSGSIQRVFETMALS